MKNFTLLHAALLKAISRADSHPECLTSIAIRSESLYASNGHQLWATDAPDEEDHTLNGRSLAKALKAVAKKEYPVSISSSGELSVGGQPRSFVAQPATGDEYPNVTGVLDAFDKAKVTQKIILGVKELNTAVAVLEAAGEKSVVLEIPEDNCHAVKVQGENLTGWIMQWRAIP